MRGMLVVHGHRQHQPVERQHAGVVGDHQRRAVVRQVLDPADLDPEPGSEEQPQQRPHDRVVEVRVEAELVDAVVAGEPLAEEFGDRGDVLRQVVQRRVGRRCPRGTAVLVDFADDSRDLFGRCPAVGSESKEGCWREDSAR